MKQAAHASITRLLSITDDATLLQNLVEKAAVPTFVVKSGGDVVYANKAFCDLLGYTPEEASELGIRSIVHPDFVERAREQSLMLESGTADGYKAERKYVRKDGRAVWVLASAALLRKGKNGEPSYLTVQAIDIDQQKRAEAALASSESRWNYALEAAGQGVWDADLKAGTLFYSRMWRIMRGFGPEEEVEAGLDSWLKRLHPDDRDRIHELVLRQDRGEIPRNAFEYRERHRNGHYIWILSRGAAVEWDAAGQPTRFVGTDTDITALKQVEAALFAEKERLSVTLKSIGDGVISTDADGIITFINPVASQMTGWSSAEALGKRVEDVFVVVDDATGAAVADPVQEALRSRQLQYLKEDAVLISRGGQQCAIRDSAAPVRAADGRIIGAVLVFQDITPCTTRSPGCRTAARSNGRSSRPSIRRAASTASTPCVSLISTDSSWSTIRRVMQRATPCFGRSRLPSAAVAATRISRRASVATSSR